MEKWDGSLLISILRRDFSPVLSVMGFSLLLPVLKLVFQIEFVAKKPFFYCCACSQETAAGACLCDPVTDMNKPRSRIQ